MILIISTKVCEITTEDVIAWGKYLGSDFIRLNGEDFDGSLPLEYKIDNSKLHFFIRLDNTLLTGESIKVIWFRRGFSKGHFSATDNTATSNSNLINPVTNHLSNEVYSLIHSLPALLTKAKWIDKPVGSSTNKLIQLIFAKQEGLQIPDTLISTRTRYVHAHQREVGSLITKNINNGGMLQISGRNYPFYTKQVRLSSQEDQSIFPSLVQKNIDKAFDIRIFYLNRKFYAAAIFSQNEPGVPIDIRNINLERPLRYIPVNLPKSVEVKLRRLIRRLEYDTCSIDMLKTQQGEYIFLEINPNGQFGFISKECNFHLDKKIAQFLIRVVMY